MGYHLWGRTESDTTEATQQQQQQCKEEGVGLDTGRLWARRRKQVPREWAEKAFGQRRETEGADGDVHLPWTGEGDVWKKSDLTSDRELGLRCYCGTIQK